MTDSNVKLHVEGEETATTLLDRIRKKDAIGWQRFVKLYSPLIFQWCRRAGLQDSDCLDVGQEVFCSVSGAIGTFRNDREGDSFRGWLRRITNNKILDHQRHKNRIPLGMGAAIDESTITRQPSMESEPFRLTADDDYQQDQLILMRQAVQMVLVDFEPKTQTAFFRVVMNEESAAEVAKELGMSVNSVYLAKSRIIHRVREEFAGLIESIG